ncbi:transglutaminase-like domain-containing protein [Ktedonobacter robiniae]|uniref:Transglutaminase-like domain-containing protein n=1 Tax=Ktedonobacter robiniae TaxID=2778365 RepID=A0ABQ3V5I1_9CHLR|nr:transglutaminase-like domain-containing protein [Ktedonobacter robiniae]GHO59832.1 hypothetical protein KSB_83070 [Ktedonobacter robiniae]
MAGNDQVLAYYREQSALTDPGKYAYLYADLPRDMAGLVSVVQGLLIPPYTELLREGYGLEVGEIDNALFGERRTEALLARILRRRLEPLTMRRPPVDRIGMICRNFAVLLVSMLRYQRVPARARVGFGGYFRSAYAADHRLAEYWDAIQERWVRVDPMIDEVQQRGRDMGFNLLDMKAGDPFWLAGEVWRRCRAGELEPWDFGDSDVDRGMPPIRYALLQDFAYLNKLEMLGNDDWGALITKPEAELTREDLDLLDRIALLTENADTHFDELRTSFPQTAYGQTVLESIAKV